VSYVIVPEVEALILKALESRVGDALKTTKAIIGIAYDEGDKHSFRSPLDDRKLGIVYRTDPEGRWQVTDRAALDEWLLSKDWFVQETVRIAPGRQYEALAVLAEHAPHLLEEVREIRAGAVAEVLTACGQESRAVAPGVEWVRPKGVLTVTPDKGAGAAIEAMHAAGLITWDGRPAIEAPEETAS